MQFSDDAGLKPVWVLALLGATLLVGLGLSIAAGYCVFRRIENKATGTRMQFSEAVAAVQASFERNQIRPGDAGYVHDKRIAFDEPKEAVSAAPVRPVESD